MTVFFGGEPLLVGGVDIVVNDDVPVGQPVRTPSFMVAHPLDAIATMHHRDPHTRVDAAVRYLLDEAFAKFDAAEWRVLR